MKTYKIIFSAVGALIIGINLGYSSGDATVGEVESVSCAGCHGAEGKGISPNPAIAGLDEAYIVEQLAAFKSGTRESPMMQMFTSRLSDQDIEDLAAFYSGLNTE